MKRAFALHPVNPRIQRQVTLQGYSIGHRRTWQEATDQISETDVTSRNKIIETISLRFWRITSTATSHFKLITGCMVSFKSISPHSMTGDPHEPKQAALKPQCSVIQRQRESEIVTFAILSFTGPHSLFPVHVFNFRSIRRQCLLQNSNSATFNVTQIISTLGSPPRTA
jgi:hypothetical protein